MTPVPTAAPGPPSAGAARPWSQAWIDALPIAPAWAGCAFAAVHVLLGALYFGVLVAPRIDAFWAAYRSEGVVLSTSVFALIIGYATAALAYARRGHETTLRELRPALACDDAQLAALQQEVRRFDMGTLRRTGAIVAVGAVLGTYFTTDLPGLLGGPALLWVLWQNALFSWLLARTIAHDLRVSRVFSRAAERHAEIELLDLAPLAPLAGRGLQSALLIVLALSVFSLIFGAGGEISPLVPGVQTATLLLAAFALVLPSLGVRRRVRDAKREELARLSREIRSVRARQAAGDAPETRQGEARLATLLALRRHVETARELPFDLGTLGRFLLYAVIGVGSWLGGAAVERLLDLLLG
jgi:hypothetical protein